MAVPVAMAALVALALVLVVGWPTAALVGQAAGLGANGEGRDPIVAPRPGELARPLGLAATSLRLIGLAERVALAGGELRHGPAPDGDFVLSATLPWR